MMRSLARLAREPLVHFLVLGAGLFVLFAVVNRHSASEPGKIVVTQGQIEHLAVGFARTWRRPPSPEEIEGLIHDYVREEVYYREAVAMGLDRDDTVIRRRLHQKLEFVSEDVASLPEPSDADLRGLLESHPDKFQAERRFTFRQVYLDPQRHRGTIVRDAAALRTQLHRTDAEADLANAGDPFLLADRFDAIPRQEVVKLFGEQFADALDRLPTGDWAGPVTSGYGSHLVRLSERTVSRSPTLDDVRDSVHREWVDMQRQKANEAFFQKLLGQYTVTIERPKVAITEDTAAAATQ
jgi:hypothetical protein